MEQFEELQEVILKGDSAPLQRVLFIGYMGTQERCVVKAASGRYWHVPTSQVLTIQEAGPEEERLLAEAAAKEEARRSVEAKQSEKAMTATFREQDRVAILGDEAPLRRGVFIGYIGSRLRAAILVEDGNLEQIAIGELIPADQAPAEERKLRATHRQLEAEFEEIREKIAVKMQTAAQMLREASELALSHDKTLQSYQLYDDVQPFLDAFDDAGWSSSSLRC